MPVYVISILELQRKRVLNSYFSFTASTPTTLFLCSMKWKTSWTHTKKRYTNTSNVNKKLIVFLKVIILDCQHFYDFTYRDHERLMRLLKGTFGPKLLPNSYTTQQLTLDFMTEYYNYQLIVIYRSKAADQQLVFWPSSDFPSPWPDTTNPNELINILNDGLRKRGSYAPHISQFVLTPTKTYICRRLLSTYIP